jgi:hypothetical protein
VSQSGSCLSRVKLHSVNHKSLEQELKLKTAAKPTSEVVEEYLE